MVNTMRKLSRREKEAAIALAAEQAASEEATSIKNAEIKELKAQRLAMDFALMEEGELRNMEAAAAAAGADLQQQVSPMAHSCTTFSLFAAGRGEAVDAYPFWGNLHLHSNARWLIASPLQCPMA